MTQYFFTTSTLINTKKTPTPKMELKLCPIYFNKLTYFVFIYFNTYFNYKRADRSLLLKYKSWVFTDTPKTVTGRLRLHKTWRNNNLPAIEASSWWVFCEPITKMYTQKSTLFNPNLEYFLVLSWSIYFLNTIADQKKVVQIIVK